MNTYPLSVEISRLPLRIDKIAIDSCLVNTIELPLVPKQVCLSQGPGLCDGQPIQLVPNLEKSIILVLKTFIDLPSTARILAIDVLAT